MLKQLFVSAAALALMTGVAFAQEETTTRERTTIQEPDQSRTAEHDTVKRTTYTHHTKKVYHKVRHTDDYEANRSHEERTTSPDGDTATRRETTTTTTRDDH